MIRRLFPAPWASAALFLAWLMLNQSLSNGHLLLAALFAWAIPWATRAYHPEPVRLRSWGTALRLTGVVLKDIVVSNVDVARRVLGDERHIAPRFVWVPVELQSPHAITMLAGIITLTPGTLSSQLTADRRHLLVHALHCPDDAAEAELIAQIKSRYEAPLKEMFG